MPDALVGLVMHVKVVAVGNTALALTGVPGALGHLRPQSAPVL